MQIMLNSYIFHQCSKLYQVLLKVYLICGYMSTPSVCKVDFSLTIIFIFPWLFVVSAILHNVAHAQKRHVGGNCWEREALIQIRVLLSNLSDVYLRLF